MALTSFDHDQFRDAFCERADGTGRIYPKSLRNNRGIRDIKILITEDLPFMADYSVSRRIPHVAPAERVGGDEFVGKRPGGWHERGAAGGTGKALVPTTPRSRSSCA